MDSMQSSGNGKHHNAHSHHGHKQKHRKPASTEQLHGGKRKRVDKPTSRATAQQLPEDVASLPVYAHKQEVLDALRTHSTLVVVGETGSGKSTQLPKIIFQAGVGSVVCTQVRLR